jgi:hypothetical protein
LACCNDDLRSTVHNGSRTVRICRRARRSPCLGPTSPAAELADADTKAGNGNDVLVIPAGRTFAAALNQQPGLVLHAVAAMPAQPASATVDAADPSPRNTARRDTRPETAERASSKMHQRCYSALRKFTRSLFCCAVNPMPKRWS